MVKGADDSGKTSKTTLQVAHSLIAGSVAGMAAKTIVAPVERIKIIYQSKERKPFTFKAGARTAEKIVRYSGWAGLWRGNSASLLRVAPYSAVQFSVHEQLKDLFGVRTYEQKLAKPALSFLAGGLGGLAAITLTYPLDVARARMATDHTYKNLVDVVRRAVLSKDHRLSLYRGFAPAICGLVPYTGGSFLIYELFKTRYFKMAASAQQNGSNGGKGRLTLAIENILLGAAVSFIGQTAIFPLDTIRRRMQTDVKGDDLGMCQLAGHIYRTEGVRGLFKGITLSWLKLPVVLGVSMVTYDLAYYALNKWDA